MVKTGGHAAGVRHKQELEILLPKSGLAAQPQISLHSSLFPSNHPHATSAGLCHVIPLFQTESRRFRRSDWGENITVIVALRHLTSCKSILAGRFPDIIVCLTVFGHWLSGWKWDFDLNAWQIKTHASFCICTCLRLQGRFVASSHLHNHKLFKWFCFSHTRGTRYS